MHYLKLQIVDTRQLAWIRAPMQARGALVTMLLHCAFLENGGRIDDCEQWKDSEWQDLFGVLEADVTSLVGANLARWDGPDLVLSMYDTHGQKMFEVKRAQGPRGAEGGRPKENNPKANPKGKSLNIPKGNPEGSAVRHPLNLRALMEKNNPKANPHTTPPIGGEGSPKGSASPDPLGLGGPGVGDPEKKLEKKAFG